MTDAAAPTNAPADIPATMRQLRSLVTADGQLELSIATVAVPTPAEGEVLVRVEAAPINPSDLGLLLAMADVTQLRTSGTAEQPVTTAPIPANVLPGLRARIGESMPVGNECCGVVVAAGSVGLTSAASGVMQIHRFLLHLVFGGSVGR